MKKVAISCDSVHVIPERAREYGLIIAPFSIVVSRRRYSYIEIDMDELYDALKNKDDLSTTSMPRSGSLFSSLLTSASRQPPSYTSV